MKHRALKLLLLLLAGAIINVAVAWGVALFGDAKIEAFVVKREKRAIGEPNPQCFVIQERPGATMILSGVMAEGIAKAFDIPIEPVKARQYAWSDLITVGKSPLNQPVEEAFGWPLLALRWSRVDSITYGGIILGVDKRQLDVRRYRSAYQVPPQRHRVPERILPFLPLWPGFAINTIFYTAVLWVLFAIGGGPGRVRRWRRIKRGQCASCGYSLRDNTSDKCPECGATLRQS